MRWKMILKNGKNKTKLKNEIKNETKSKRKKWEKRNENGNNEKIKNSKRNNNFKVEITICDWKTTISSC